VAGGLRPPALLPDDGADFGHASIEFRQRLCQLRAATLVRGRFLLALHFRARQLQRLQRLNRFHLCWSQRAAAFAHPLLFQFFHPLLNSRLCVNQSFASITHIPTL